MLGERLIGWVDRRQEETRAKVENLMGQEERSLR
jgi:hypothetical protein